MKTVGAGGDGLSPNIWHDCPILQMMTDPTLGVFAGDDFTFVQPSTATSYPYAVYGTGGTFSANAGAMYGQAKLATGTTANNECYVTSNSNVAGLIKADASHKWWFEARVQINKASGIQGVFVGLAQEAGVDADFMTDTTMALKMVDVIGFQILSASNIPAVWQTVIQKSGGSRTAINSNALGGTTNFVKLGIKSVPKQGAATITFYADGVPLTGTALSTATNFPLNKMLQATFATKTGAASANVLLVDWWFAAQLR